MNTIVPTLKECERRRCAEPEQSLSHDHVSVSMRNARLISSSQACYNAAAGYPLAKMTTRLVPMPNHPLAVEVGHIALERLKLTAYAAITKKSRGGSRPHRACAI